VVLGVSIWCRQVDGTKGINKASGSGVSVLPWCHVWQWFQKYHWVLEVGGLRTFMGCLRAVRSLEAKG